MDNPEEYLLRVLRRTQLGLQDSLMPAHAEKLVKLVDKFDMSSTLLADVSRLKFVDGFSKCAVSMEWLLKRVENSNEIYSPEQFESDVLMLNEKIFEAFLNQPFDIPESQHSFDASAIEGMPISTFQSTDFTSYTNPEFTEPYSLDQFTTPQQSQNELANLDRGGGSFNEPDWSNPSQTHYGQPLYSATDQSIGGSAPSLNESLPLELLDTLQRTSDLLLEFGTKLSSEKAIAMAVLRMTAKTAVDNSRVLNNIFAQDFFQALVNLVNVIDQMGKIKDDTVGTLMMDIGDRVKLSINSNASGVTFLKKITEYLSNPKELVKKN